MINKINTLKDNSNGVGRYLVTNATLGVTAKGIRYLTLVLSDDSGSIDAKYWTVSPEEETFIVKGSIIEVAFDVTRYNGSLQLRVNSAKEIDKSTIDLSDFIPKSPVPVQVLKQEIRKAFDHIENPIYKGLVQEVFKKVGEQFFEQPAAAKNHHSFYAGLATHVASMVKLANALCDLYPMLNKDLLVSGVLLHDIGKCYELDSYVATQYTVEGNLIGHISIMHAMLVEISDQLGYKDSQESLLLRHMVLSHHGQLEFGSPVRPAIVEAEMLCYIDNIDAKMNMLESLMNKTEPGEFSERAFALENRRFYKPHEKNQ